MPDKLLSPEYGLSNARLQECTANPSDVISGKTFYSGDKNKKTGVMPDYGYEPIGKSCTLYNPGDGIRLYIYLPNADTNTQDYGGKIIRSLSIPIDQVYNAIGNRVLDDDCVSTRNILDGSVTSSKLDSSVGSQIDISTNVSIKDRYTKEVVEKTDIKY